VTDGIYGQFLLIVHCYFTVEGTLCCVSIIKHILMICFPEFIQPNISTYSEVVAALTVNISEHNILYQIYLHV